MKAVSIEWNSLNENDRSISAIEAYISKSMDYEADVIVFPGFSGLISEDYLENILKLSLSYRILICPGSIFETDYKHKFHTSYLIKDGTILLKQRQIYLSRTEKQKGFSRGTEISLLSVNGFKLGILMPTDVFYPQVSRELSMNGADLVLVPSGYLGNNNNAFKISGVWNQVQQNLFFAVESCFNGKIDNNLYTGESAIYSPLLMTEDDSGILAKGNGKTDFIFASLDNEKRKKAIEEFDVLELLNPDMYKKMGLLK